MSGSGNNFTTWQSSLLDNEKWWFEPFSQSLKALFFGWDSPNFAKSCMYLDCGEQGGIEACKCITVAIVNNGQDFTTQQDLIAIES